MSAPEVGAPEASLVASVARLLEGQSGGAPDLVPAGEPIVTGRSTLHRYTDRASGRAVVVKVPVVVSGWVDTEDVLPPAAQYEALERAYGWQAEEDRHAVVRPIGMLPEHDAFAMDWASGRTVLQAIHRSPLDPAGARAAIRGAGDFLQRFHRHGLAGETEVPLAGPAQEVLDLIQGPLRQAGLRPPRAVVESVRRARDRTAPQRQVLLHGDYVPSNLILKGDGAVDEVVMIDPLLAHTGPAVDDVARFLTVLSSPSVFLPGVVLAPVRRLRQGLEREFLTAYGLDEPSALLELRLLKQHLLRWLRRRENSRLRGLAPLMAARGRLIDLHMRALLRESAARLEKAA